MGGTSELSSGSLIYKSGIVSRILEGFFLVLETSPQLSGFLKWEQYVGSEHLECCCKNVVLGARSGSQSHTTMGSISGILNYI